MRNQPFVGYHGGCGGEIRITDYRDSVSDRNFSYEAFCKKCRACDPNGYSSVAKTVAGARDYFQVTQTAAAQERVA